MKLSEIKAETRHALKGQWIKAICIFLLFYLILYIAGYIKVPLIINSPYKIFNLLYDIIYVPLSFGLVISFMKLKRGEKINIFGFFKEGFSRFGKSWGIAWHTFVRLLLPILCLIICSFFILSLYFITFSNIEAILFMAFCIFSIIYMVFNSLSYILAHYIAHDNPELSSKECVLKSAELMKGNRGKYFLLQLYFIVLLIVIIYITAFLLLMLLAITLLSPDFIMPIILLGSISYIFAYMQVATICFYDRLVNSEAKKIESEV